MTHGKSFRAPFLAMAAAGLFGMGAALAQDTVDPATADAVSEGAANRFSLVRVDGEILRVDRQNGTVSVCSEQNGAWRCNPVPLAEEAYLAEINELAGEVDRLTARLEKTETGPTEEAPRALPPGSALDRPGSSGSGKTPGAGSRMDKEDEEELEKVLTFTESAMRRFFGMVRDLKKDFETDTDIEGNN